MRGTLLESHFRWQIRTFWFDLLWGIIGSIMFIFCFSSCTPVHKKAV